MPPYITSCAGATPARSTETVEYREFSRYAKDGDYYGYWRLARDMGVILRTEITVDESGVSEPLFGRTLD